MERAAITEAIIQIKHIPIGMEFFPASNLSQLEYIKKLIVDTDYYVLIIGGRYGSIDENSGKSFTHLEFEYANKKGIPIIVFYPKEPKKIPLDKTDEDQEKAKKLNEFIKLAKDNRLAREYLDPKELKSEFIISIIEMISENPRTGWIRANANDNTELLQQINDIRIENEELKEKLNQNDSFFYGIEIDKVNLVDFNDKFSIVYSIEYDTMDSYNDHLGYKESEKSITFMSIFKEFGDKLIDGFFRNSFTKYLKESLNIDAYNIVSKSNNAMTKDGINYNYEVIISDKVITQLLLQLEFINIIKKGTNDFYQLTPIGRKYIVEELVLKKVF